MEGEGTSGEPIPKGEKPEELVVVDKFVEDGVDIDGEILVDAILAIELVELVFVDLGDVL